MYLNRIHFWIFGKKKKRLWHDYKVQFASESLVGQT